MSFDPELRFAAQLIPRFSFGPRTVRAFRWLSARMAVPKGTAAVKIEPITMGGAHAYVFRPSHVRGPQPALLWLHGGGYVVGTPAQDADLCRRIATELGIVVVAPFYRLAPDHPFPAALDDARAALNVLATQAEALGVRADRIAIGGASAGAGLAATLALDTLDRGGPSLRLQLLVYPMLDDRTVLRADVDETFFRLWNGESNRFGWRAYLACEPGGQAVPIAAVPSRAASLANLPPAWIGVGEHDLFHDENVAYAQRLRVDGVACELEVVPGAYHGFDRASPHAVVSRRFYERQREALRRALF